MYSSSSDPEFSSRGIKLGRLVHRPQHSRVPQLFSELLCLTSREEIKGNKKFQCCQTQLS